MSKARKKVKFTPKVNNTKIFIMRPTKLFSNNWGKDQKILALLTSIDQKNTLNSDRNLLWLIAISLEKANSTDPSDYIFGPQLSPFDPYLSLFLSSLPNFLSLILSYYKIWIGFMWVTWPYLIFLSSYAIRDKHRCRLLHWPSELVWLISQVHTGRTLFRNIEVDYLDRTMPTFNKLSRLPPIK